MVAVPHKSTKLAALGLGAVSAGVAALMLGSGIAAASPNDPGMTNVRPDGTVNSRQSASTSGANHCQVSTGTLSTAGSNASGIGVPSQRASEAGPSWVGSDGWQAIGLSPSNPWRGNFNRPTKTGPQCKKGRAGSASRF